MLEFSNHIRPAILSSITIYNEKHLYTPDFIELTRDFYYNM